jgi:hypothetical protein
VDICRRTFGAGILGSLAFRALALPPRPKLLVLIVIEQLRPDYLDAVWDQLGPRGLRRLVENGAYFPDCRHLASSYTSTTLATLATGAWPAQHGIVADTWFDRAAHKPVGPSEEALLATTLVGQVAAAPDTRTFVVALDAMDGALFAGSSSARQFWMDDQGAFLTRGQQPAWVPGYNRLNPLERLHNAQWIALGANPGAPPLRTLRFDPNHPQDFLAVFKASPFALAAEFDFLQELLIEEDLGHNDSFDFVCLISSPAALLGYETGARSPLMQQMTLHLDRQLESLFDQLDRGPGADAYNLVLAGAHGAPPAPRSESRARMSVNGELLAQGIQQKLTAAGNGRVEKYLYPFLYLENAGAPVPESLRQAAGRAALELPGVAAYYTASGECSVHDQWERRFRNSFHPRRAGDLMLSYLPEYIEDYGGGVSYGSLYTYDIQVPLCFYGPQFRPGIFEPPVELVDVAPTLARAIGVEAPSSSSGRVLGEAFAGSDLQTK